MKRCNHVSTKLCSYCITNVMPTSHIMHWVICSWVCNKATVKQLLANSACFSNAHTQPVPCLLIQTAQHKRWLRLTRRCLLCNVLHRQRCSRRTQHLCNVLCRSHINHRHVIDQYARCIKVGTCCNLLARYFSQRGPKRRCGLAVHHYVHIYGTHMSQPLKLSFHHQTQGWALHSAGSGIAANLLASNPGHLKAKQTIKDAPSTCSLNQVVVNLTWRQHGCLDGVFSDRMKINALHRNLWL